jgi:hypothetical protein
MDTTSHAGPLTLDACGDTLSIRELCAVLGIGKSAFFTLKEHGVLLIAPLPGLGGKVRYSKTAVRRYLDHQASAPRRTASPTPVTARRARLERIV